MDLVESGAIFNFKPFNPQTSRDSGKNETLNSSSRSASRTNSRFEELFLASPRAQELVSTIDQTLSFTSSRSRIISPHKQQSFLHDSLEQAPLSSSNADKNASKLTSSGLVNMLDFFRSGQQPRNEGSALFSPLKPSNHEEDSLRTQVTDVINKLRTPINRQGRANDEDGLRPSLNTDSGYDDRQIQSCGDSINDGIATSGSRSLTPNDPQHVLPGMALELREENNDEVNVLEPDVEGAVQEEDVDVGEYNHQSDTEAENIESRQKQSAESTEENMECNVVPESDIPDVPEITEINHVEDKTKEPLSAESPSQVKSDKKPHHLFGWYIKALKTKNGPVIIVEGQRREDPVGELWHSTGIVNRVSTSLVETKSKSQYVLEGNILAKETIEQGFSEQFAEAFTNGFPPNWEQLVKEHFDSISNASSKKSEQPQKVKKSSVNKKQPSLSRNTARTPRNAGRRPVEVELKRTSSGRLIKPPLAWWRGQRIVTDAQHNLTSIDPGGEEHTALSVGLYDFDLKLPKNKSALLNSTIMTPKVAKYKVENKTKGSRKNQSTTTKGNVAKSAKGDTQKRTARNTETSSPDGSESESTGSTSYSNRKKAEDSSEKPSTSHTESDASSFPKVMRPKPVPSDSSWKPSDSDSTAMGSSKNAIQKSKKPKAWGKSRLTLSRKQHSEFSTEESDNEEEDDRAAKDLVKRNITFSDDDDDDSKSSRQKLPQEKGSFINFNKKEKSKYFSNALREVKVVLEKNQQLTRSRKQMREKDNDSESQSPDDNDESDTVNSSEDDTQTNALGKDSSKFRKPRKPESHARNYKKNSEAQSHTESSSEENGQPRRSLRKKKESNQVCRNNNSSNKNNNRGHKEYDSHGTRTRSGSQKYASVVEEEEGSSSSSDEEEAQAVAEMLSNVRQRKAAAESQASEATSDSDSPKKKLSKRTARKTKNQKSKPKSTQNKNEKRNMGMEDGDDVDGCEWKEDEIFRLSEALHSIPLSTYRYWQSISELVQTRTAQECQLKYNEQLNLNLKAKRPVLKPKVKQPKANQKVVAITGGVGTIKRKRELRQLIQQNNDGYEDDIFESTPYKNTQKKFKFFTDEKDEDSDAEEEGDDENDGDDEEHNHMDFKTPSSRTPSSRYRPLGPAGSMNTPGSDLISPSLLQQVNREGMDHYIHRMKQAKKGVGQYRKQDKVKVVKTSTPKKKVMPLIPKGDASIFDVQEVLEQDSDEENDYYWSDE